MRKVTAIAPISFIEGSALSGQDQGGGAYVCEILGGLWGGLNRVFEEAPVGWMLSGFIRNMIIEDEIHFIISLNCTYIIERLFIVATFIFHKI